MNPFREEGSWLRCALHAHTTNSDGELPPELLVRHYDWAGFDVLAITDHWVRTDEPSTDGLLVIPSTELDARIDGTGRDAHVLALGVRADPVEPGRDFPTLEETVAWLLANGVAAGVEVRCSPARSVTAVGARRAGSRVNAGRLGYPLRGEILEHDDEGLIVSARLSRPASAYGRLEIEDSQGRKAWTNPLWI